tara:strand:- start:211 stop:714 length:504 start_codon:yes stop_codon:yes gene_type:complete
MTVILENKINKIILWKSINSINFQNCKELLYNLKKDGFKVSPWIENIVEKYNYSFEKYSFPIELVKLKLIDLGLDKPTDLQNIYKKILERNFSLVPPAIAIFSRKLYLEQPTGEWLRFATPLDSMVDTDGVPHLPKIGKALGSYFVETYWSYPKAIFHPHNEFIVVN